MFGRSFQRHAVCSASDSSQPGRPVGSGDLITARGVPEPSPVGSGQITGEGLAERGNPELRRFGRLLQLRPEGLSVVPQIQNLVPQAGHALSQNSHISFLHSVASASVTGGPRAGFQYIFLPLKV